MEERLARELDDVLARADSGASITLAWLRRNYPDSAGELAEILALAGKLRRPETHVGMTLGPCRLLSELGRGGMATVYLAEVVEPYRDLAVGRRVAMKIVHGGLADNPKTQQRFMTEGVLGTRIRHPNIVPILGSLRVAVPSGAALCLLMEPIEGMPLSQYRPPGDFAPESLCRFVVMELAQALSAVHAHGIVHRDVKPHNVMISSDHQVLLMDLGVAQVAADDDELFIGSPLYAAPEQLEPGRDVDARADLFSLGLTAADLALGRRPEGAAPFELPDAYSPFLVEVVRCLTQPDPDERFSSSRQLVDILTAGTRSGWWRSQDRPATRLATADAATSKLHGREVELAELGAAVERAGTGHGAAWVFVGDPGVGKTRALSELIRRHLDVVVASSGYQPDQPAAGQGGVPRALTRVPGMAASVAGLPETLRDAVAAWLQGDEPPTGTVAHAAIAQALAEIVGKIAGPVALWVDDLHLAPAEHLIVLSAVASRVAGSRVLLLGSGRPGPWSGGFSPDDWVHRTLAPLSTDAILALLRDASHPRRLANTLLRTIAERAEGNPLFGLSILWSLQSDGALSRRADGTWAVSAHVSVDLPHSLEATLRQRIVGLEEAERGVLDAASIVGAEFDSVDVAAAMGTPTLRVVEKLEHLSRRPGLVQRSRGGRYRFDHHCLQELLYRETPPAIRSKRHRALAEFYDRTIGGSNERRVAACHHAIQGGATRIAKRRIQFVLGYLLDSHQYGVGAALGRAACEVPGLLEGRTRLDVFANRASLLRSLGRDRDEMTAMMHDWLEEAEAADHPQLVRALRSAAEFAWIQGDADRVVDHVARGLHLLDTEGDDVDLRVDLLCARHKALHMSGGPDAAREDTERLTELVDSCDEAKELQIRMILSASKLNEGGDAYESLTRCVQLAESIGARRERSGSLGFLGEALRRRGRLDDALASFERAIDGSLTIGERHFVRFLRSRASVVLGDLGRYADAERYIDAALSDCMDSGDWREAFNELGLRATNRLCCGDFTGARDDLEHGLRLAPDHFRGAPDWYSSRGVWAIVEVASGHLHEGGQLLADVAQGRPTMAPLFQLNCAEWAAWRDPAQSATWMREAAERSRPWPVGFDGLARAWIAALDDTERAPSTDDLRALAAQTGPPMRMRFLYLLWSHHGGDGDLQEARKLLSALVERAPERCEATMVENVPLYAAIRDGRAVGEPR